MKVGYVASWYAVVVVSLVAMPFLVGCGQSRPSGMPPLVPCELTLVQAGAPLTAATVVLTPIEGTAQWNLAGISDETGVAKILANGQYNGVPAGSYKVTVVKYEQEASKSKPIPQPGEPGYEEAVAKMAGQPAPKRFTLVDPVFTNTTKTTLTVTVEAGKKVTQTLDLGKAVKIAL